MANTIRPDRRSRYSTLRDIQPAADSPQDKAARYKELFNGQGRDRTADTRIFSPVLYQLSYLSECLVFKALFSIADVR